jgi:6-phosphofructokinase 2
MTRIVTLTMNPALDVSTSTERVVHTHKLRCAEAQRHPGGGGINVARVLHRLGSDCLAVYPVGGTTGQQLRELLDQEQVSSLCIPISGETRASFSVHELGAGRDWRFVLPGPALSQPEWQACRNAVASASAASGYLVASGSLPPGVPIDFYAGLARLARERGTLLAVDTSGPALAAALAAGVWLAKPSLRELCELTGRSLETECQWLDAARAIVQEGRAQLLALSLGADGAALVTRDTVLRAPGLAVDVASTIGAGDSFTAGLLFSLSRGDDLERALRTAIAAGSAALLTAGTALCRPADVERLREQVRVTRS